MGEAAEMMLDGTCCAGCGEFLHDGEPPGYPMYCAGCEPAGHKTPRAKEVKRKRRRRARQRKAQKKRDRLAAADTAGWQQLSPHHFRKGAVDWWPSTGKYATGGKLITEDEAHALLHGPA